MTPVISAGDLVARLKSRKGEAITRTEKLMDEAAARIQELEDRVRTLEAAVAPFADFGEYLEVETEGFSDTDELDLCVEESGFRLERFYVGAFRRARSSLNQDGGKP
jgi:hypothetical protein